MNAIQFLRGFRKFTAFVLYFAVMAAFTIAGFMNGAEFSSNVTTGLVAFCGTNIGEHLLSVGKDWVKNKVVK